MAVPDKKVARLQWGNGCNQNGAMTNVIADQLFVLDYCVPNVSGSSKRSSRRTVVDGIFESSEYLESSDCTGPAETESFEVGKCTLFGSNFAQMVIPAVDGVTLSSSTSSPTISSTLSPTSDDDGANNGTGNSATDGSASIFALVAAMVGAVALMF